MTNNLNFFKMIDKTKRDKIYIANVCQSMLMVLVMGSEVHIEQW